MLNWLKNILTPGNPAAYLQQAGKTGNNQAHKVGPDGNSIDGGAAHQWLGRKAKLIMVTANNNNKFYEMEENPDGTFTVLYGRVGGRGASMNYPIHLWDSKLREKIRKGYLDQTELFKKAKKEINLQDIKEAEVRELVNYLMRCARQSIRANYHVSADQVTIQQVDTAQGILDQLVSQVGPGLQIDSFNELLLSLYQVIPRKMSNVSDHLVKISDGRIALEPIEKMLAEEQSTLDVMKGQVEILQKQQQEQQQNLLESMGLEVQLVNDPKAVKMIRRMMGVEADKFYRAFKVTHKKNQYRFDQHLQKAEDKKTELFWHGSRNENWLSIMQDGLLLKPANAIITGKMFGYGLYFADKCRKSLNYTSLTGSYWARGRQEQAYLALYDVHVGKQLRIRKHQAWCNQLTAKNLKKRGQQFDSVYARGGVDLINNEYIVYDQAQCTIRYLIEIRK